MKTIDEVRARIKELEAEFDEIESGRNSYGDSDQQELEKIDAKLAELKWVVGDPVAE